MNMKKIVCAKCGSDKIIPEVRIVDYGHANIKVDLTVELIKKKGFIYNDVEKGAISAKICGQCGNVELNVSNYEKLWEVYCKGDMIG